VPNFIKISQKRLRRYGDLTFFSKWRPSIILDFWARIWTTHDEHFVVFGVAQNLVGIDAVVLII